MGVLTLVAAFSDEPYSKAWTKKRRVIEIIRCSKRCTLT